MSEDSLEMWLRLTPVAIAAISFFFLLSFGKRFGGPLYRGDMKTTS